jgi:hypothetical protein
MLAVAVTKIAPASTASVAIAITTIAAALTLVTIGPAHHWRRSSLVLIHPDSEESDDVGGKPHLALKLGHSVRQSVDIH